MLELSLVIFVAIALASSPHAASNIGSIDLYIVTNVNTETNIISK